MSYNPPLVTTPIGTALWPDLHVPSTRYKPEGEYSVKLVLDPTPDADALFSRLQALRNAAVEDFQRESKTKVKVSSNFPMQKEEDGRWKLKATLKAHVKTRKGREWDQRPALFDSQGKKLADGILVGTDSKIRFTAEVIPYNSPVAGGVGISLRLRAVQVIVAVEPRARDATSYGFDVEQPENFGGFEEDDVPQAAASSKPAAGGGDF